MRHLVVANATLRSERLWELLRARAGRGDCVVHLLVPATYDPAGGSWAENEARREAAARLEHALADLRALGVEASGTVGEVDAPGVALEALAREPFDEVIVSTLSTSASRWLRMGILERLREATDVPVVHVVDEPDG